MFKECEKVIINYKNMLNSVENIIQDIKKNHFVNLPDWTNYSDLYIWVTNDINRRLKEHNVTNNLWLVYWKTTNSFVARGVEKYFLDLWMQWWDWWWDNTAVYVYCYQIWPYTKE